MQTPASFVSSSSSLTPGKGGFALFRVMGKGWGDWTENTPDKRHIRLGLIPWLVTWQVWQKGWIQPSPQLRADSCIGLK